MSDPPDVARALCCGSLNDVMYLLQSNRVDLGFIGGAEIDRFGNLNTHWVEEKGKRTVSQEAAALPTSRRWRNAVSLS